MKFTLPKVLVTSIHGHKDMIEYLSDYRTQDKMHGKHYYPSGMLCWFETNQYGDPTGSVYCIRKVPDLKLLEVPRRQRGYRKLLDNQKRKLSIIEKWCKLRADETKYDSHVFNNKRKE